MNRLAEKDFQYRLPEDAKNPDSLSWAFNDMAEMFASYLNEHEKNNDFLQGILESTTDMIITVNPAGFILSINSGAEEALGYNRDEVIGKEANILFKNPDDRSRAMEKLEKSNSTVNIETQFVTKTKELRDVLLSISRLRNPKGDVIGTLGISKDITEERKLQSQLNQKKQLAAIGEVFTGVQHSMKNMLNACLGGGFMIRTGLKKDDRALFEEGWDIVQDGINRMTVMSRDMLKFVKDNSANLKESQVNDILNEISKAIIKTAEEKGIYYETDFDLDLKPILNDSRMLHTAIMDIVSNALDACFWKEYPEGEVPKVTMRSLHDKTRNSLVIEIKDNGIGMSEDVQKNIFTPFFSTKSKSGTGLGMSIASRMISAHNGQIELDSTENVGTIFRILLPYDGIPINKEKSNGKKSTDN